MPEISVIIPTYNLAGYIDECVQSVLAQTFPPVEILIVDNNSADGTLDITLKLADRFPELIRVLKEPRQGAPFARNLGLQEAKGGWIQFIDGDDLLMPDKLRYQVSFTLKSTGFIVSPVLDRDVSGNEWIIPLMSDPWIALFNGGGHLGFTVSNLWKTSAVRGVGGWDTSLLRSQEYDLMFRLMVAGYLPTYAPDVHAIVRHRPVGQISSGPYAQLLLHSIPLRIRILRHLLAHNMIPDDQLKTCFSQIFRLLSILEVRDPQGAGTVVHKHLDSLVTPAIERRIPQIHWYRLRSRLYVSYQKLKAAMGWRGLLGKLSGRFKDRLAFLP